MQHKHGVFDSDTRFTIDPITRQVRNASSRKTTLIQFDHNSERFTFEIPRFVEGHDMSLCNKVEVHYLNVDAKTQEEKKGVYVSTDLQISPDDDSLVICSWLISNNATQLIGGLSFIVRYCCVDDSIVTYAWNTAIAQMVISSGIDGGDFVAAEYADVLEQWKAELFAAGYINASTMQANIADLGAALDVERKRIDQFIALQDGSTTGDAELQDIRVGADGIVYNTAGEAVRQQMAQLAEDVDTFKGDIATSFEYSGEANSYNYRLLAVDYKSGDTLHFLVKGVKCNIICVTASDTKGILLNQVSESNDPYEVVLSEDIVSLGIYMLGTGTAKVYVVGGFLQSTYEVLGGKVDGNTIFTSNKTELNTGLLFRVVNGKVTRNTFASGNCAKCNVASTSKAIISGFGWNSDYNYFLYAFTDGDNNALQIGTEDNASVNELEVDVPEGAVYLFVNGRIDNTDAEIKVLNISTNFEELHKYYEAETAPKPKLITLGDSITALGTGNRGWIKYFIEKTRCELVANVAVDGAVLSDYSSTEYDGNPAISTQKNNVLGNQVQKIAENAYEAPNIIIIAIGTNGGIAITEDDIKSTYYDEADNLIPLAQVDRTTDAGAYRYCTETLHNLYPDAIIFWCSPIMGAQGVRSAEKTKAYAEALRIATEYSGQIMIDSIRCGINGVNEANNAEGEYLIDGLHPNAKGAKRLGYYNAGIVKPFI